MSIDRKPRTYRRRTTIGGQFAPRLVEMLESPAWRVLSLAAHRVLDRLDIEHRHHGGRDNGKLTVTYLDFEHYGIARNQIAPALREVEALGFIEITQRGRAGNAEHRTPHKFRLTSYDTEHAKGTNEWRQIATIEDAERIAQQARNRTQPKHSPHPISDKSHPGNRGRKPQIHTPEIGCTAIPRKQGVLSISRDGMRSHYCLLPWRRLAAGGEGEGKP